MSRASSNPCFLIEDTDNFQIYLTAINELDCEFFDTLNLGPFDLCNETCELFVPNVFSPNNDGINDLFGPISDCEPEVYLFRIYNRWGSLIYETSDFSAPWDGTFNAKQVGTDVFIWSLKYQFAGQSLIEDAGDVTVIR